MNKTEKFLKSLPKKERDVIEGVVDRIKNKNWLGLNIIKLSGSDILYRVRVGRFRIVFSFDGGLLRIIYVNKRDDNTYKDL